MQKSRENLSPEWGKSPSGLLSLCFPTLIRMNQSKPTSPHIRFIEKVLRNFKESKWIFTHPKLISNFQMSASTLFFLSLKLFGVCDISARKLDFKLSGPLSNHAYHILVQKNIVLKAWRTAKITLIHTANDLGRGRSRQQKPTESAPISLTAAPHLFAKAAE